MRQTLSCAVALALVWLSLAAAQSQTPAAPKKTAAPAAAPQKKAAAPAPAAHKSEAAVAKKSTAPAHTAARAPAAPSHSATGHPSPAAARTASASAAKKGTSGKKAPPKRAVTWRTRQNAPSQERYREIQNALVSRGYLSPEEATGAWNQTSIDALKRFQAEQNIESSGKINSLSLIALGLGPKHEGAPVVSPKPTTDQVQ